MKILFGKVKMASKAIAIIMIMVVMIITLYCVGNADDQIKIGVAGALLIGGLVFRQAIGLTWVEFAVTVGIAEGIIVSANIIEQELHILKTGFPVEMIVSFFVTLVIIGIISLVPIKKDK